MEKEQSKPIESLSFEQLFKMAEQKEEEFDYDEAEYFYQLAYKKNPFNEVSVMCYSNILKQNDKTKQAKAILQKSIKDYPNGTYKRFFILGELYNGVQAIKTFEKGIQEAIKSRKNPFKSVTPETQIKRDVAQAYATIAQICMTDLIDEPQAEGKCIQALKKGVQIDARCMDVHVQTANYQLWKQNFEIARAELDIILQAVKSKSEQLDNEIVLQAAKYYIELEQFQKSMQLLETIHEQESNESEVVYLLAYCAFKSKNYEECEDYIEEYQEGAKNIKDQQIQEAMNQLISELKNIKKTSKLKPKNYLQETEDKQQEDFDEDNWMDVEGEEN